MSFKALVTAFFLLFATCAITMPDYSEAARLGGGRSFGSKPAMRAPAPQPQMQRPAQSAQRQNAAQTQQPARKGFLGGMGGILGGLLAGTLLGSLLSGAGFSGGGFLDILLIGLLVFLGLKLFARRRASSPASAAAAGAEGGMLRTSMPPQQDMHAGQDAWGALRSDAAQTPQEPQAHVPAGFDTEEFLRGAKMAYTRLQAAWDKRDLDDIAQFATPAVLDAVREQMAQEPGTSHTEIMLVNAQLLEVSTDGSDERAQVYFDVLLRESPDQPTPTNAREIWHFVRQQNGGTWKLDGIQQIA